MSRVYGCKRVSMVMGFSARLQLLLLSGVGAVVCFWGCCLVFWGCCCWGVFLCFGWSLERWAVGLLGLRWSTGAVLVYWGCWSTGAVLVYWGCIGLLGQLVYWGCVGLLGLLVY